MAVFIAVTLLVIVVSLIACNCWDDVLRLVSARNVALITFCTWYLAEAVLRPSALLMYSQTETISGLASVALSVVAFVVGYERLRCRLFSLDPACGQALNDRQFLWHTFLMAAVIGFLPLVVLSRGNLWVIVEDAFAPKPRWSSLFQRGRYGDARDAFLELQMFLRAATPLAASILLGSGHKRFQRLVAAMLLIYLFSRGLHDGSRLRLLEVTLTISAAIFWRCSSQAKRWLLLMALPAFVAVNIFWAAAAVRGRDAGRFAWRDAFSVQYTGFEMFRELLFLRRTVPATSPWQWGYTYYVQAINPVPRFLWPSKPIEDAGLQLAVLQKAVVDGEPKLTIAPGLIGEMYWNYGLPGIAVLSAMLGMMLRWWDEVGFQARQSLPLYTVFASGLYVVFATGRSVNLSTVYGLLSLYATVKMVSWWKTREATGS